MAWKSPKKKPMVRKVFQYTLRKMIPLVIETEKQSMAKLMANNQISRVVIIAYKNGSL
jgi:hypothetical protein